MTLVGDDNVVRNLCAFQLRTTCWVNRWARIGLTSCSCNQGRLPLLQLRALTHTAAAVAANNTLSCSCPIIV